MGVFQSIFGRRADQMQLQQFCERYMEQTDQAMRELMELFSDSGRFIDPEQEIIWKSAHQQLLSEKTISDILSLKKTEKYHELATNYYELTQCAKILSSEIQAHNDSAAQNRVEKARRLIGTVEGHPLDEQQMMCLVREAHSHLVLAGAGTGKTTTILGKIKYLLASGQCEAKDLLVLSFTNASASEMRERIRQETGCDIAASTFHKLGLSIIQNADGTVPQITNLNLKKFIREQLQIQMKNPSYLKLLTVYLTYYRLPVRSEFSFHTLDAYREYLAMYPPRTIRQETLRTYGEMDIANFLTQNGIAYRYDYPCPLSGDYESYRPSFYLPEKKAYIQYYSLSKDRRAPSWFPHESGKSATQSLLDRIAWEREVHRKNGSTMIECYAYESMDGTLFSNLEQKLAELGIVCKPISSAKLWEKLRSDESDPAEYVADLLETVINLLKSNHTTIPEIRSLNSGAKYSASTELILALVTPVYHAYCQYLSDAGELDFNDMINRARCYVEQGRWKNPYRYVIVDEYQDISASRFELLKSMRVSSDFRLFCVGDDWQSIYRFAGSDVGFILSFEHFWGPSQISKIETTYRFPQKLIEITGEFIMQNPAQIRKNIRGRARDEDFPLEEICGYTEKEALRGMLQALRSLPNGVSVFLIGRYSFDGTLLQEAAGITTQNQPAKGFTEVKLAGRDDLSIRFLTAHRSKGLQADYVFILNNRKSRLGFPSKVQEAPIMGLLLDNWDRFPDAEERRLFYVAMTRARRKVFLLTVHGKESDFIIELHRRYEI